MKKTAFLLVTTLVTFAISPVVQAAGPLRSLVSRSGCDVGCDAGCGPALGCETSGCDHCGITGCDGGCSNASCDSGCDAMGCNGCLGDRVRSLWNSNDDCCPESCRYVSLFGGWSFLHDYNSDILGGTTGTFSDGWAIGGAVGRRFGYGLRGELETGFRSNAADQISIGGGTADWSGHLFAFTSMANVLYDVRSLQVAGITPYVGGGIGVAAFDGDINTSLGQVDIHDAAFAYQAIVGGSKRINSDVELFAEYRYFATTEVDVKLAGAVIDRTKPEYENVFFGLRINR